jgi:hypothetical protein
MKEIHFNRLLDYRTLDQLSRMNDSDRAGLLAEILQQPPSETSWQAIWELFASWPNSELKSKQLSVAEQALATWPDTLRCISSANRLLYDGTHLSELARLARAVEINRRETYGSAEALAIASSEYSNEIRYLSIRRSEIDSLAWRALVESPYLDNLRHLHVRKTVLGDSDIQRLFQSSRLPRLQCLKLIDVGIQPRRMDGMRHSMPFADLSAIDLSSNALGDDGVTILSQIAWLSQIKRLTLRDDYIGLQGMRALLLSPFAEHIDEMDVAGNRVPDSDKKALLALAASRNIRLKV